MKYYNAINLFWTIIWAVVLVGVIVGIFWKPSLCVVALVAAAMLGSFVVDFIRVMKMK